MLLTSVIVLAIASSIAAQEDNPQNKPKKTAITVAIVPFDTGAIQTRDAGKLFADILAARLSMEGAVRVVERERLEKVLAEQKLAESGLLDASGAGRAGKLLGADLLLMGHTTQVGKKHYIVCKAVSTRTSEMKGFFFSAGADAKLEDLIETTASKLNGNLPRWYRQMLPRDQQPTFDTERLRKLLGGHTPEKVAIIIPETHLPKTPPDPAVETEFKKLLADANVPVVPISAEGRKKVLASLQNPRQLSLLLDGARYLIYGEAFSEEADPIHGLRICKARAELKVIDLKTGAIMLADRETGSGVGLSSVIAGKTALQKIGRVLTMRMMPKLIEGFPKTTPRDTKTRETKSNDNE